jgi:hypothetical protein
MYKGWTGDHYICEYPTCAVATLRPNSLPCSCPAGTTSYKVNIDAVGYSMCCGAGTSPKVDAWGSWSCAALPAPAPTPPPPIPPTYCPTSTWMSGATSAGCTCPTGTSRRQDVNTGLYACCAPGGDGTAMCPSPVTVPPPAPTCPTGTTLYSLPDGVKLCCSSGTSPVFVAGEGYVCRATAPAPAPTPSCPACPTCPTCVACPPVTACPPCDCPVPLPGFCECPTCDECLPCPAPQAHVPWIVGLLGGAAALAAVAVGAFMGARS